MLHFFGNITNRLSKLPQFSPDYLRGSLNYNMTKNITRLLANTSNSSLLFYQNSINCRIKWISEYAISDRLYDDKQFLKELIKHNIAYIWDLHYKINSQWLADMIVEREAEYSMHKCTDYLVKKNSLMLKYISSIHKVHYK